MSVLRLSGPGALHIARQVFSRHGKHRGQPWQAKSHRIYYGHVVDQAGTIVDEVTIAECLRLTTACCVVELPLFVQDAKHQSGSEVRLEYWRATSLSLLQRRFNACNA